MSTPLKRTRIVMTLNPAGISRATVNNKRRVSDGPNASAEGDGPGASAQGASAEGDGPGAPAQGEYDELHAFCDAMTSADSLELKDPEDDPTDPYEMSTPLKRTRIVMTLNPTGIARATVNNKRRLSDGPFIGTRSCAKTLRSGAHF
jgi:hypothetical protein